MTPLRRPKTMTVIARCDERVDLIGMDCETMGAPLSRSDPHPPHRLPALVTSHAFFLFCRKSLAQLFVRPSFRACPTSTDP